MQRFIDKVWVDDARVYAKTRDGLVASYPFAMWEHLIAKSGNKWSPAQKERAEILFAKYPKLKELHSLLCQLRQVFADFPFFMYRL